MSYDLRSALGWITAIAVIASIFSYVLSLVITAVVETSTSVGTQLLTLTQPVILWAFFLGAEVTTNSSLVVTACLIVFVICFIKAATANEGFLAGLRTLATGAPPKKLPNWLAAMPLLATALLLIELLLSFLQDILGAPTGMLGTTDPAQLVPGLALAPIAEEFGFRITVLGLVTGILIAWKYGKTIAEGAKVTTSAELKIFFSAFLSPGFAKEKVGLPSIRTSGWKGISIPEWIFLAITSVVFGAYHWPLGGPGGWGPGKFLTAALSGFALGIVYLAYGAYANILLHWFFDLNFFVFDPTVISNGALNLFGILYELGAIALGVWSIIIVIYWIMRRSSPIATPVSYPGLQY